MNKNYFQRVKALTPTKFWVNNVTRSEADLGLSSGATGCTQNPSYTWKMLTHETEGAHARDLLAGILKETDDSHAAETVLQRKLVQEISERFMPLWKESGGRHGYVSIQGDPINEDDPGVIIQEARINREMNPNVMIKIPATKAGLAAMDVLIAEDTPLNATEVMSVSQTVQLCEMYHRTSHTTGKRPVMYYSLITGIFNEWLRKDVAQKGIAINPDVLHQAGLAVAKKVYHLVHDRGYELGFIGGGVRTLEDFTEMVGGDVCITMNWNGSCDSLIEADLPVVSRFFNPIQEAVLDELLEKLPQFRQAYYVDGLDREDFEEYGPVEYFRDSFVDAWKKGIECINQERQKANRSAP